MLEGGVITCHFTGITEVRTGTAEKMSLQTTAENSVRTWRGAVVWSRQSRSGDQESSVADSRQTLTTDDQWRWWRWAKTTSSLEVRRPEELVSEKCHDSEFELDSLRSLQPMQLVEKWRDWVVLWWQEHQPGSRVHHWLQQLKQVRRNSRQSCITNSHVNQKKYITQYRPAYIKTQLKWWVTHLSCTAVKSEANSAFHPSRVGKRVEINVITWITTVDIIKHRPGMAFLVAGQRPWARAWTVQPIGCTPAVCDTKALLQLQHAVCGTTWVLYAPAFALSHLTARTSGTGLVIPDLRRHDRISPVAWTPTVPFSASHSLILA